MPAPLALRRRPPARAIHWVEGALGRGARVTRIRRLRAGTSAAVHLLRVDGCGLNWVVLRRFVRTDWLAREPDLAEHEAHVLDRLAGAGLPMPELLAVDPRGEECDVPAVLMTRIRGHLDLAPRDLDRYVRELAAFLPRLHALHAVEGVPSYRPWFRDRPFEPPAWTRRPALWRRAEELVSAPSPDAVPTFIHRDYHPGNVLWRRGRLTGVADWVNACNGPAAIDVAHCAVNLAVLFGASVVEEFRRAYEAEAGVEQHPYWDLLDALDTGAPSAAQWRDAGRIDLTDEIVRTRVEEYLDGLVRRLS